MLISMQSADFILLPLFGYMSEQLKKIIYSLSISQLQANAYMTTPFPLKYIYIFSGSQRFLYEHINIHVYTMQNYICNTLYFQYLSRTILIPLNQNPFPNVDAELKDSNECKSNQMNLHTYSMHIYIYTNSWLRRSNNTIKWAA